MYIAQHALPFFTLLYSAEADGQLGIKGTITVRIIFSSYKYNQL
jgi:hypothetical protein